MLDSPKERHGSSRSFSPNLVNRTSLLNKNTHTSLQHVYKKCQMSPVPQTRPVIKTLEAIPTKNHGYTKTYHQQKRLVTVVTLLNLSSKSFFSPGRTGENLLCMSMCRSKASQIICIYVYIHVYQNADIYIYI